MIRMATPIVLAALGGVMTSQAGILNSSLEGTMIISAFSAVFGSYLYQIAMMGILFGILEGMLMSIIFSLFVIKLKADEFVIGIALNIFAAGLTVYLSKTIFGTKGSFTSDRITGIPDLHFPVLDSIPVIGEMLNNHSLFIYLSWLLVGVLYFFLYHTHIFISPSFIHIFDC